MWFFVLLVHVWAEDLSSVNKARDLFLRDGRVAALSYLSRAIENPKIKPDQKTKLISEGLNLSQRFLTDKAQRDFETAMSTQYTSGASARGLYEKALAVEPDNLEILISLVLLELSEKKCSGAASRNKTIETIWSQHPYFSYLQTLVKFCEKETVNLADLRARAFPETLKPFAAILEIRILVANGRGAEAIQLSRKLRETHPNYAEPLYWLYKAGQVETEGDIELLKKYVSTCDSYNEMARREFRLDPTLCGNVTEATQVLKNEEVPK